MTKVIFRPEPVFEPNSNQRVQTSSVFQNRESSARLFEQALVRVEVNNRTDQKTQESTTQNLSAKNSAALESTARSLEDFQAGLKHEVQSLLHHDLVEEFETAEIPQDAIDSNDEDTDIDDKKGENTGLQSNIPGFLTSGAFDASPMQSYTGDSGGTEAQGRSDETHSGQPSPGDPLVNSQNSQTEILQLTDLSEIFDIVQDSGMSGAKEWHFSIDNDSVLSELTLAAEDDGAWRVGLAISPMGENIDPSVLPDLQRRLENSGLSVSTISIQDLTDQRDHMGISRD